MIKILQSLPDRLARITSGRKLIREIDGLRFIAILPVLIQHLTERFERNVKIEFTDAHQWISFLAHRGFLGVYIFFAISGFVLALPFASHRLKETERVNVASYFWRRITRLEPPYIIWMTFFFLVFLIHNRQDFNAYFPHYLANISYTHALIYNEWSPFNPPTWTLEIEIQFYILAPLLAYLSFYIKEKNKRRIFNVIFIILLMLLQQYFKTYLHPYSLTILGHLHYFLIGFFLADIYLCDRDKIKRENILYDFIAIASLIGLIYGWSWNFELWNRFAVVISLFFFFIAAFKGYYINKIITNRWIMAIGGMCYTIYLIHLPLAEFFIAFTKGITFTQSYSVNLLFQLLLFLPLVIFLSIIFFLLFEKPFMNKHWIVNLKQKIRASFF